MTTLKNNLDDVGETKLSFDPELVVDYWLRSIDMAHWGDDNADELADLMTFVDDAMEDREDYDGSQIITIIDKHVNASGHKIDVEELYQLLSYGFQFMGCPDVSQYDGR